ncbi:MAG: caspase family protein [Crocosphaera sp.]
MTSRSQLLIIGIDYYGDKSGLKSLDAPSQDAEAIACLLKKYWEYQKPSIRPIPDQEQLDSKGNPKARIKDDGIVTQNHLEEAIAELLNPPDHNPPDTALLFFSGHGVPKEIDGRVEVYLATSDRLANREECQGVAISWLGEQIQKSKAKEVIVWLDCCYSGELLKYCPDNKRYCFVTATTCYSDAYTTFEEGELTKALKKGLNPEDKSEQRVDSDHLLRFLADNQPQHEQRFEYKNSPAPIPLTTLKPRDFRDKCPYVALNAFQKDDADYFFGRTTIIGTLLNKLENKEQKRLVAILGASGSGKSSLMRAGLLYELKRGQKIAGSNNWLIIEPFSPTNQPLEVLQQKLSAAGLENIAPDTPIILMVDQFEECFTMCDEETRKEFINKLLDLLKNKPNLQITLAMRDDFRSRLREFQPFREMMSIVNVEHLKHREIEEAIIKPAQKVGLYIYPDLKQQLINDVEDYPGSLPLLQYTLTELWNQAHQERETSLRLETYSQLGGIEGTLQNRATEIYESLSPADQTVAKRIFLELVQVGDISDTRRRVTLGQLQNSRHDLATLDRVTEFLANKDNRLLTRANIEQKEEISQTPPQQEDPRTKIIIDVVHEALIRNWKMLGDWKQEYREGMIIERRIEQAAQQWHQGKGDLWQVAGLEVANKYQELYGQWGMLDGIAEQFIEQTRNKVTRNKWTQRGVIAAILAFAGFSLYTAIDANRQKIEAQRKTIIAQANAAQLQLLNPKHINPLLLALDNVENNLQLNKNELIRETYNALAETVEQTPVQSTFRGHQFSVLSVAFSPDGKTIVSGSSDGTIKVWDAKKFSIEPLHTFNGHQESVNSVAFSPDGKTIISGSFDGTIKVWNAENPSTEPLYTFQGHHYSVNSIAFSPDGKTIISGSSDGTIKVWSAENRSTEPLHTFNGHQESVMSVAYSPDGKTIISGSRDRSIKVWSAENPSTEPLHTFNGHQNWVMSVAVSPDGKTIISGSSDGTIKVWNAENPSTEPVHTFNGHQGSVWSVAFSPDGKTIVSGSYDNTIKVWNAENSSKGLLHTFKGHQGIVNSLAFSPDGKTMVSGSFDGTIKVWSAQEPRKGLLHTFKGHQGAVISVAFSPDGKTIISGSYDNTIKVWSAENPSTEPLQTFQGHQGSVNSVTYSPDGKTIISGSLDKTIKVWNAKNPNTEPLQTFQGHQESVNSVTYSPDGKTIVSGSSDRTIKVWSVQNRSTEPLQTFQGHQGIVSSVAFSPDGKTIISGSYDNTIKVWSAENPSTEPLYIFKGHQDTVTSVTYSPDGKTIISGSRDRSIKVWSAENPSTEPLYIFKGHQGAIKFVAFNPDGKTIISGSTDNTIKVWRAAWQDWVAYACGWLRLDPDFALPADEKEIEQEKLALEGAVKLCMMNHGNWEDEEKADFLIKQGLAIAIRKEDIEDIKEPMEKFKQAQRLDKTINIQQYEQKAIKYVEQRLITVSRKQAGGGNLEIVKAKLVKLKQLNSKNPELDLVKLRKELMTKVAVVWANEARKAAIFNFTKTSQTKFAEVDQLIITEKLNQEKIYSDDFVANLVNRGKDIAKQGSIESSMLLYEQAQKIKPDLKIDAVSWNELCLQGSLYGYAKDVLEACNQAVDNASAEEKTRLQDSRGLARALTGDRQGAIKDFQAFIDDETLDESQRNKRKQWVEALKKGDKIDDIFTEEVLEELKNE